MLNNLFQTQPSVGLPKGRSRIFVHPIIAFPIITFLSLWVVILSTTAVSWENATDESIMLALGPVKDHAHEPQRFLRDFTSVDAMKLTKDTVRNQADPNEIKNIVEALSQTNAKYIAVSVPLDSTASYPDPKPFPQTVENFTQSWAEAIHKRNLLILWRGTWSGMEGLYNFPKKVGPNRFPAGSAATAATDGDATWLGKTYAYIVNHPEFFENGDIWAPMPERTEGIFQDQTSFLPYNGSIQQNYALFFSDLKKTSDQAFAKIGKQVYTGWSANNLSEVNSGWIYSSVFNASGLTVVDYYGSINSPQEMENSIVTAYRKTHQQIFLQEWSDYWNSGLDASNRQIYLNSMYATFQKLADEKVLMGFNYWGGWPNATESILSKTASGYILNSRGLQLADFFRKNN